MPIGLGIGLAITRGGTPGFSLTAPVATWVSDAATAQAVFEIDQTGAVSGDTIYGEAYTDAGLTSQFDTEEATIATGDIVDGQIDDFAFSPFTPDGTYYCRFAIRRGGVRISQWSDTVSKEIATSSPFDVSFLGSHPYTSSSTPTKSAADFGVADGARKIAVAIFFASATVDLSVTSVTIGGVTASLVTGASYSGNLAGANFDGRIYEAEVPTGTSGDIVVTLTNTSVRGALVWWRVVSGTSSAGASNAGTGSSVAITPTIPASGVGLFASAANNFSPYGAWTNLDIEDVDGLMETGRGYSGGRRTTAGSTTVTANVSGNTGAVVLVGCAYGP